MENKPVWTIARVLEWTKQYFANKGIESPRLDAEVLLCSVLKCQRITLYVHFDQPLQEAELVLYRSYVNRRGNQEPLAYILGEKDFMHYTFKVSPAVLVPRPETELLVESIAKFAAKEKSLQILDIGTGSGAIIASLLALLPQAQGTAVDISAAALNVAQENVERLGVDNRLQLIESDLYSNIPPVKLFDVIVSNPPYIPQADIAGLALDVQKEPYNALDGGVDGLDFYKLIVKDIWKYLQIDGLLALEIGINQAQAVVDLCKAQGLTIVVVHKDYNGIDRMVFATREGSKYANHLLEMAR